MRRTGALALLLAAAASQLPVASPDETPPLGLYPESPRPNRPYWRGEEFAAAWRGGGAAGESSACTRPLTRSAADCGVGSGVKSSDGSARITVWWYAQ